MSYASRVKVASPTSNDASVIASNTIANASHTSDALAIRAATMLRGRHVEIVTIDQHCYQGVMIEVTHTAYSLGMVQRVLESKGQNPNAFEKLREFPFREVISMREKPKETDNEGNNKVSSGQTSFRTDTEISNNTRHENRNLQKWTTSEVGVASDTSRGLATGVWVRGRGRNTRGGMTRMNPNNRGRGAASEQTLLSLDQEVRMRNNEPKWDQFAANKKLFGYESSYQEDDYTIRVDRNSSFYRANEKEAERLAKEIQSQTSVNTHMAEERGQELSGASLDPESAYSAVLEDTRSSNNNSNSSSSSSNRYRIPAKRSADSTTRNQTASRDTSQTPANITHTPHTLHTPHTSSTPHTPHTSSHTPHTSSSDESLCVSQSAQRIASSSSSATPTAVAKPKSKLNATAKEFSMNASVMEFVPSMPLHSSAPLHPSFDYSNVSNANVAYATSVVTSPNGMSYGVPMMATPYGYVAAPPQCSPQQQHQQHMMLPPQHEFQPQYSYSPYYEQNGDGSKNQR